MIDSLACCCKGNHAPGSDPEQTGFRRWLRHTEHVGHGLWYVVRRDDTDLYKSGVLDGRLDMLFQLSMIDEETYDD